ncbi:MAG: hypothetical protein ACK5XN_14415 [Bacteroidota bacterium]
MSIFISMLAFESNDLQDIGKTSVMVASLVAILLSYIWFRAFTSAENEVNYSDIEHNDQIQNPS